MHSTQENSCLHGCRWQVKRPAEGKDQSGYGYGQEYRDRLAGKTQKYPKENTCQQTRYQDCQKGCVDWHRAEMGTVSVQRHAVLFPKGFCESVIQTICQNCCQRRERASPSQPPKRVGRHLLQIFLLTMYPVRSSRACLSRPAGIVLSISSAFWMKTCASFMDLAVASLSRMD